MEKKHAKFRIPANFVQWVTVGALVFSLMGVTGCGVWRVVKSNTYEVYFREKVKHDAAAVVDSLVQWKALKKSNRRLITEPRREE